MSWTPDCCPHCGVLPKNCNLSCQRERIAELAAKTIALDEAFATIERSRQRVADMTRALEWAAGCPETLDDGENVHCLVCSALYGQPHDPDCRIGIALASSDINQQDGVTQRMSDISAAAIEDVVVGLNTVYAEFLDDNDKEFSQATALRLAVELINTLSARRDQLETFNDEAEQALRFCRQRVADMTRALEAAKVAFRGYEVHHRAKGADTKAETNRKLADMCISVLSSSDSK